MELHQLRYFVAVADCNSFRRAAAQCHVAQPSLSQQVIKLEKSLGYRLFDRLGRSIALTEAGHALLPRAKAILRDVSEAQRDLGQDIDAGRGPLAVGAIPTIAPFLLPRAIGRFSRQFPEAELSICEDLTESLVEKILKAELDLGILSLPLEEDLLEVDELCEEPLWVVSDSQGELAGRSSVPLEELRQQPAVVLHEMHCLGEQIQAFCHGHRVQQRIVCRTAQLSTVQSLVALGMGISLVPRMCAAVDRSRQRAYRPLEGVEIQRTVVAVSRRGRSRSRLTEAFLTAVRREVARIESLGDEATFSR